MLTKAASDDVSQLKSKSELTIASHKVWIKKDLHILDTPPLFIAAERLAKFKSGEVCELSDCTSSSSSSSAGPKQTKKKHLFAFLCCPGGDLNKMGKEHQKRGSLELCCRSKRLPKCHLGIWTQSTWLTTSPHRLGNSQQHTITHWKPCWKRQRARVPLSSRLAACRRVSCCSKKASGLKRVNRTRLVLYVC